MAKKIDSQEALARETEKQIGKHEGIGILTDWAFNKLLKYTAHLQRSTADKTYVLNENATYFWMIGVMVGTAAGLVLGLFINIMVDTVFALSNLLAEQGYPYEIVNIFLLFWLVQILFAPVFQTMFKMVIDSEHMELLTSFLVAFPMMLVAYLLGTTKALGDFASVTILVVLGLLIIPWATFVRIFGRTYVDRFKEVE